MEDNCQPGTTPPPNQDGGLFGALATTFMARRVLFGQSQPPDASPNQSQNLSSTQTATPLVSGTTVGSTADNSIPFIPKANMPNIDPKAIKTSVKVEKRKFYDKGRNLRTREFIVVTLKNESKTDVSSVRIGATNGRKLFKGLANPAESAHALDHIPGRPNNVLMAGETRTASIPKIAFTRYRLPIYVSGKQPDGTFFRDKRRPTVFSSTGRKIFWSAIAATSLITTAIAFLKPADIQSKQEHYTTRTAPPDHGKKHENAKPAKPKTNAELTQDFKVTLGDSSTCILPAGTKLNDRGAAKNLWPEARHLVTIPNITGSCQGKIPPKAEQALPEKIIRKFEVESKQSSSEYSRPASKAASVKYTHTNNLG